MRVQFVCLLLVSWSFSRSFYCDDEAGYIYGDPFFVGFLGQKFLFDGHIGGVYNIFSDPYVSINARFGTANSVTNEGTIMNEIGLKFASDSVSFGLLTSLNAEQATIRINEQEIVLTSSANTFYFGDCREISFVDGNKIIVATPEHVFSFRTKIRHDAHIVASFFDIGFKQSYENAHLFGGILGQTARNDTINLNETLYTCSSLVATDAPSNTFSGRLFECKVISASRSVAPRAVSGPSPCPSDYYCQSSSEDYNQFECILMDPCSSDFPCPFDSSCMSNSSNSRYGSCLLDTGISCLKSESCTSNSCVNFKCVCSTDSHCKSGFVCNSGQCSKTCTVNTDCDGVSVNGESYYCSIGDGVCKAGCYKDTQCSDASQFYSGEFYNTNFPWTCVDNVCTTLCNVTSCPALTGQVDGVCDDSSHCNVRPETANCRVGTDCCVADEECPFRANFTSICYNQQCLYYPNGCFLATSMVVMADGTQRQAQDVSLGDYVQGLNGPALVLFILAPKLGDNRMMSINGQPPTFTVDHTMATSLTEPGIYSYDVERLAQYITRLVPTGKDYTPPYLHQLQAGQNLVMYNGGSNDDVVIRTIQPVQLDSNTDLRDLIVIDRSGSGLFVVDGVWNGLSLPFLPQLFMTQTIAIIVMRGVQPKLDARYNGYVASYGYVSKLNFVGVIGAMIGGGVNTTLYNSYPSQPTFSVDEATRNNSLGWIGYRFDHNIGARSVEELYESRALLQQRAEFLAFLSVDDGIRFLTDTLIPEVSAMIDQVTDQAINYALTRS